MELVEYFNEKKGLWFINYLIKKVEIVFLKTDIKMVIYVYQKVS
jgi:hypothetical protein